MSRVCAHCGEVYQEEGRLVCPHCGVEAEFTWAEEPPEHEFGAEEEEEYRRTLEAEGLAPKERKGCLGAALLVALVWAATEALF